jgi:hypothetical protein
LHPICNRELCICDYQSLIIAIQSNAPWQINNYLDKNKSYLPFLRGTCSHLGFYMWVQCCDVRYDFRIQRRKFVFTSIYLQEGSCRIYVICVCLYIVVSSAYCVVLLLCLSPSCVYVASFAGLSILDCSFGIL